MRLLARTWRVEIVGAERWAGLTARSEPYVLLCWHEGLLPVMWHHRGLGISALVSEARDGEYLSRFAGSLGYGLIRGSSTRGGTRALRAALRALATGTPIGVTPDGPRGPPRVVKPGALVAAARTGAWLVPVHAEARPAWRARSWDRFLLPAPFARVRLAYAEPFRARSDGADAAARVAGALEEAARLAAWPHGAATPTA
jgi:lysophospholipid acyltransferase (LPLAT)-like uncharacterized protein